jgi:repressor LexA
MKPALSRREREVYEYLCGYIKAYGRSPSVSEIATALPGRSKSRKLPLSTVSELLDRLEEKGFLVHGRFGPYGYLIAPAEGNPLDYTYVVGRLYASGQVQPVEPQGFTFKLDVPRPDDIFFLIAAEAVPSRAILAGDLLLFEHGRPVAPDDLVLFAVGEPEPDPYYYVAQYVGLGDRELVQTARERQGVSPADFIDRQIHGWEEIRRLVAELGPEGGYFMSSLSVETGRTTDYQHFLELANERRNQVQSVGVQIGLFRLTSHWQRELRKAPV